MNDLIYADGGGDDVRVYLGLGNGLFQAAPVDFAVGTDPAGVTVAYLNGSQAPPDLIVANEGSNDISVLLGQGTGAAWTLIDGPRLRVGAGPSATSVADLQHDGVLDLVVSESLANDVRILPGLADGFFNDQDPTIIPTGSLPGGPVFMPTGAGPPVIAVPNAGSDSITLIDGSTFDTQTVSSEGSTPVSLIVENETTLLVANESDGHLGIFDMDASGDVVSASYLIDSQLLHLSALALDTIGGFSLYATTEGEDTALLFPLGNPVAHGGEPSTPGGNPDLTQPFGELDTAASFTPTLVSVTSSPVAFSLIDTTIGTTSDAIAQATSASVPIGLGQPRVSDDDFGQDTGPAEEILDEGPLLATRSTPISASLPRKFTESQGLDKAFEQARRQIRSALTSEAEPGREAAGNTRYNPSIIENEASDPPEQEHGSLNDMGEREGGSPIVIDGAIGLSMDEPRVGPRAIPLRRSLVSADRSDGSGYVESRQWLTAPSPAVLIPWTAVILGATSMWRTARHRSSSFRPGKYRHVVPHRATNRLSNP